MQSQGIWLKTRLTEDSLKARWSTLRPNTLKLLSDVSLSPEEEFYLRKYSV